MKSDMRGVYSSFMVILNLKWNMLTILKYTISFTYNYIQKLYVLNYVFKRVINK